MSWLFSQAQVVEYLGENFSDGEQSVPLSGNPNPQAYCAPDKMTDFSRLSRFGMTYKPLTESRGEELLTWFLAGFHAKTSVPQEKAQELTENEAECGEKWHGLLARFDPDTHLWRTVQCSLLEDLNESLETLPKWGMTVDGGLYPLPMLVQNTNENEFGLWLTPTVMDGLPPRNPEALERQYQKNRKGRTTHSTLREQVVYPPPKEMWPTPNAWDGRRETGPEERGESTNQESSDQSDNGNQDERTGDFSNTQRERLEGQSNSGEPEVSWAWSNSAFGHKQWWLTEPRLGRVAHGVAHRVDRLKAIGNGQVPLCAATAWRILTEPDNDDK